MVQKVDVAICFEWVGVNSNPILVVNDDNDDWHFCCTDIENESTPTAVNFILWNGLVMNNLL